MFNAFTINILQVCFCNITKEHFTQLNLNWVLVPRWWQILLCQYVPPWKRHNGPNWFGTWSDRPNSLCTRLCCTCCSCAHRRSAATLPNSPRAEDIRSQTNSFLNKGVNDSLIRCEAPWFTYRMRVRRLSFSHYPFLAIFVPVSDLHIGVLVLEFSQR